MVSLHPKSLAHKLLTAGWFRWLFALLTVVFSAASVVAMMGGNFRVGGNLAAVAAAFATILLVSLTAQYATQTQELVKENRRSREQRSEELKQEQNRELMTLRKSLLTEISAVVNIDEIVDEGYYRVQPVPKDMFPTTIYENNADRIGLLDEEEREAVVAYYSFLQHLDFLAAERSRAKAAKRPLPFATRGDQAIEEREEKIAEWVEKISSAQDEAVEVLETRIDKND